MSNPFDKMIVHYIFTNEWIFNYLAIIAWLGVILMARDIIFGIHWLRDLVIPAIFIGMTVGMYLIA